MGEKVPYHQEALRSLLDGLDRAALPDEWRQMDEAALLANLEAGLPEHRQAPNLDQPIKELIDWALLAAIHQDGQVIALSVHALVRDFCRYKLGETWRTRLRDAAAFYTNLTKLVKGDEKSPAAVWGEMEAVELLIEGGDFDAAAELLASATPLLHRWGFGRYLESQYRRLMGKLDRPATAVVIQYYGMVLQDRDDYGAALKEYQRSLAISEELGERAGIASSLFQIGTIHQRRGEYESALEQYQRSLAISEELGQRKGVALSLHQIGMIHEDRGEYEAAFERYERSLAIFEELGDRAGVARALHHRGNILFLRNDLAAALEHYKRSLEIEEQLGNRMGVADSLRTIGLMHQYQGEFEPALEHYLKSMAISEELGYRVGVAGCLHQIGYIHHQQGAFDAALEQYQQSLAIREDIGDREGAALSRGLIGQLLTAIGRYVEAFALSLLSLAALLEMRLPQAKTAADDLKVLRSKWGEEPFDAAWLEATGEDVPDWLK